MIAEKARLFNDHHAMEIIMSSPHPSTNKGIGSGVRNFYAAVWDRERENIVLSGHYVKFTQNPATNDHPLSTGNERLAEASPLNPVWGIDLRADDPRANDPRQWRGKQLLGEAFSAVHEAIRESENGLVHPASPHPFRTPTWNAGIQEILSAPHRAR